MKLDIGVIMQKNILNNFQSIAFLFWLNLAGYWGGGGGGGLLKNSPLRGRGLFEGGLFEGGGGV